MRYYKTPRCARFHVKSCGYAGLFLQIWRYCSLFHLCGARDFAWGNFQNEVFWITTQCNQFYVFLRLQATHLKRKYNHFSEKFINFDAFSANQETQIFKISRRKFSLIASLAVLSALDWAPDNLILVRDPWKRFICFTIVIMNHGKLFANVNVCLRCQ